jgi:hypothetical protein
VFLLCNTLAECDMTQCIDWMLLENVPSSKCSCCCCTMKILVVWALAVIIARIGTDTQTDVGPSAGVSFQLISYPATFSLFQLVLSFPLPRQRPASCLVSEVDCRRACRIVHVSTASFLNPMWHGTTYADRSVTLAFKLVV